MPPPPPSTSPGRISPHRRSPKMTRQTSGHSVLSSPPGVQPLNPAFAAMLKKSKQSKEKDDDDDAGSDTAARPDQVDDTDVKQVLEIFPSTSYDKARKLLRENSMRAVMGILAEESTTPQPESADPPVTTSPVRRTGAPQRVQSAMPQQQMPSMQHNAVRPQQGPRSISPMVSVPVQGSRMHMTTSNQRSRPRAGSCPDVSSMVRSSMERRESVSSQNSEWTEITQALYDSENNYRDEEVQQVREIFPKTSLERSRYLLSRNSMNTVLMMLASESAGE